MATKRSDEKSWSQSALAASQAKNKMSNAAERLVKIGGEIVNEPAWQPHDGKTFCNFAVDYAASVFGYDGFHGDNHVPLMANDMIAVMAKDQRWKQVGKEEAWDSASNGKLVVACKREIPHGHVVVVAPGPKVFSQKWATYVPQCFNTDTTVNHDSPFSVGINFAFRELPAYYALV